MTINDGKAILQFDHVFMPYMLARDGRPVIEHIEQHLPQIENLNEARP